MNFIDSHVHIGKPQCLDFIENYKETNELTGVNIACLSNSYHANAVNDNILAMIFKALNDKIYAHGALVYPEVPVKLPISSEYNLKHQAEAMINMGFDGIKMLEGKPVCRKITDLPLDSAAYDEFYKYAQDNSIHIIMHAADPETFWNAETAPEFSAESGWFYGDGTFPTKEQIYDEIQGVLTKFPKLHMTLAHFYFLSDFYDEAQNMMEKYPNISFDITPGREMYENFTKTPDKWHDFFEKYSKRIWFGTDNESDSFQGDPKEIVDAMRRFLETDDTFEYWGFEIKGIKLGKAALSDIYSGNFIREVGAAPKKMNRSAMEKYITSAKYLLDEKSTLDFAEEFLVK